MFHSSKIIRNNTKPIFKTMPQSSPSLRLWTATRATSRKHGTIVMQRSSMNLFLHKFSVKRVIFLPPISSASLKDGCCIGRRTIPKQNARLQTSRCLRFFPLQRTKTFKNNSRSNTSKTATIISSLCQPSELRVHPNLDFFKEVSHERGAQRLQQRHINHRRACF